MRAGVRGWARLEATYSDADPARGWAALHAMTELFRDVAVEVAARFGFDYPWSDDRHVTAHLRCVEERAAGGGSRT